MSKDKFKTTSKLGSLEADDIKAVTKLDRHDGYLFLCAKVSGEDSMRVTTDGELWLDVHLPTMPAADAYKILDASENAVFMRLNSDGAVYASSTNGSHFVKTLSKVRWLSSIVSTTEVCQWAMAALLPVDVDGCGSKKAAKSTAALV